MSDLTEYFTETDLPVINNKIAVLTAQITARSTELQALQAEYQNLISVKAQMQDLIAGEAT